MKKFLILIVLFCTTSIWYVNAQNNHTYSKTGIGAFSISYPTSWSVVMENKKVTEQTTIAVQIMEKQKNSYDFRPNINVISDIKRMESTANLTDITIAQNKKTIPSFRLNSRDDNVMLSGCKGSRIEYSMTIQGYNLRAIQYIVKKSDNTTFTITATLDANKYNTQKDIANHILNSLIIK